MRLSPGIAGSSLCMYDCVGVERFYDRFPLSRLNRNHITDFPVDLTKYRYPNLRSLYDSSWKTVVHSLFNICFRFLQHNRISSLPQKAFRYVPNLKYLCVFSVSFSLLPPPVPLMVWFLVGFWRITTSLVSSLAC